MDEEVKQPCWDCRTEHSVAVEELDALQRRERTWHTLRDATIADVVGCLFWESALLTRYLQRLLETGGTELAGGVGLLYSQGHAPYLHTVEMQL